MTMSTANPTASCFRPLPPGAAGTALPGGRRRLRRAAVENGADAVYFGLQGGLNARAKATNFTPRRTSAD